ncbi:MAG: alpha/beta hydrolase [Alphaproteobacteria bacterium]
MIPAGEGAIEVLLRRPSEMVRLPVPTWRPAGHREDMPVLIVVHGVARNAATYRDAWIEAAGEAGALLLAPEFSRDVFPTPREFEVGRMRDGERRPLPRAEWSYLAIEAVFDAARAALGLSTTHYRLYGHSAGAQFVHRMVTFVPDARIASAVAANAGCYTMPWPQERFPYGLGEMAGEADLAAAFARPLGILLGERDDDPDHGQLLKSPEAMRQGPHRLARGLHYFERARETAAGLGLPFAWRLRTVPDVGHSNRRLAAHAARFLFEL